MAGGSGNLVVSAELRERLLLLATRISQSKGAVLFRHSDPVRGVFLICSGRVRLSLDGVDVAFPPRILGAGSVVGLPATVAGSPYSLTAQVVEDAELAFVPRDAVVDCLKQNPQLCFEVMDMLSAEISGTRFALKKKGAARRKS